jgi:hypothetical protein
LIKTTSSMLNTQALIAPEGTTIELLDYLFSDGSIGKEIGDKTPVAICVAPASHFEDGCARFMSLKEMTTGSTSGITIHEGISWNTTNTDAGLTKFATVAVVDGEGVVKGVDGYGFIPAKRADWSGNTRITARTLDGVYYGQGDSNNPSAYPFLEDGSLNPNYAATKYDGSTIVNILTDVNGEANTTYLVNKGDTYKAANACRRFTPGTHNGEWYLPAMGELGYAIALYDDINAKIAATGNGVQLDDSAAYWSSTEYSGHDACTLLMRNGRVDSYRKSYGYSYVRAFLKIKPSISQVQINSNLFNIQDARVDSIESQLTEINSDIAENYLNKNTYAEQYVKGNVVFASSGNKNIMPYV